MSIRTFWHLIIKTLGIWIVLHGIMSIPQLVMNFFVVYGSPYGSNPVSMGIEALLIIIPILFYLLILRVLVLKTQWIIDTLKLEKGLTETRIDLSIPFEKLLRIIVILIGGIMFVLAAPILLKLLYLFITENLSFRDSPQSLEIITNALQTIIGFLIMNNSDIVLRYIHKKSGESETKQLDKDEF